ncbi:hypothetical protein GOQ30_11250 [Flavobacterium sp. TP390]|uniref:Uncharacterized protein n=1 Tax=Flavobacterium profundi TaxID=1774945 RepID=A0A6I4IJH5_9FLAO|nr:hypothetical protein [Flavobacterium profundi]MVO09734.1 hypothetical protein [Flavobacterium profundi]
MNDDELNKIYQIFKQLTPKLDENIQLYNPLYKKRELHVVKYEKAKKIIAVWLDFDELNQWKLKILFKRHKEVQHQFFIKEVENFYRVGWKIK